MTPITQIGRLVRAPQVLTSGTGATYTKPAMCNNILVELVGGGGGGGGNTLGAGGGAGAYACKYYANAPSTLTYTVGSGGVGGRTVKILEKYYSSGTATSYTTGSFTPNAGDLLVCMVSAWNSTAAGSLSDSLSGTWTDVTTATFNSSTHKSWMFVKNAGATASAQTVTMSIAGDSATECTILVVALPSAGSLYGSSAVVQSRTLSNNSGLSDSFGVAVTAANTVLSFACDATSIGTPPIPPNFAEITRQGTSFYCASSLTGWTGTGVDWGGAGTGVGCAISAEFQGLSAVSATAGGNSTITDGTTLVTAPGGSAGGSTSRTDGSTALGGAGGTTPTNGDVNSPGASGRHAYYFGGSGSARTDYPIGAEGGCSVFGGCATQTTVYLTNGPAGRGYGAGGGGSYIGAGGDGAGGCIVVWEFA